MSLILEALKKSEARRQLGEAPGIGTPFTVAPRRRNVLPLIVILILVGAGFGWWYLRTAPPAAAPPTASTNAAATPARPATRMQPATGTSPASATTGNVTATPARPSGPAPASADAIGAPNAAAIQERAARAAPAIDGTPNFPGSRNNNARRAFPVRPRPAGAATAVSPGSMKTPESPLAQSRPSAPPDDAASALRNTTPAGRAPIAAAPAADTKRPPQSAAEATADAAKTPVPVAATPAPANARTAAPDAAPAPAVKSTPTTPKTPLYYELPYDMRKDLPALVISMHVYAADPAQRFLVVGERKAEGETLKDGLTLREIRTDGAVFEFRGQPFFYPRPGR